jgi:hypothetical protein
MFTYTDSNRQFGVEVDDTEGAGFSRGFAVIGTADDGAPHVLTFHDTERGHFQSLVKFLLDEGGANVGAVGTMVLALVAHDEARGAA